MPRKKADELKSAINIFENHLESLEGIISDMRVNGKITKKSLVDFFYEDMLNYLLYLSCCDGFISSEESEFIERYLGFYMTPMQMKNKIAKDNLFSEAFESTVPATMTILLTVCNDLSEEGEDTYRDLIEMFVAVCLLIGSKFIQTDGDPTANELSGLFGYTRMLQDYRRTSEKGYRERAITDYEEKTNITDGIIGPVKVLTEEDDENQDDDNDEEDSRHQTVHELDCTGVLLELLKEQLRKNDD